MKSIIILLAVLIIIPNLLIAEEKPEPNYEKIEQQQKSDNTNSDTLSDFSNDIAELYEINEELYQSYEEMAAGKKDRVNEVIQKALDKIREIKEKYENSAIYIKSFSIGIPFGVTIDFEIDLSKL